ncbi:MAG: preprotein translocase subunit SecG [Oscillospiraceae bacterium]|nr:preprotein translocase subunit SecG [Oscillospiraceae bacterium]
MEFGAIQIVGGILMLISSILIIVITSMQEQKQQDMGAALSGQSDNFFGKGNVSSSKEQALARLTKLLAIVFFVVTIAVNIIPVIVDKISAK